MKTLLISENFPPKTGGTGRWFWEIYQRLPRSAILIAAGEDPRQDAFDRTHDLPVARLPLALPQWGIRKFQGLCGYWRALQSLHRLIADEPLVSIHSAKCLPEGLLALALHYRTGTPYLSYVHGEELNIASTSKELVWLTRQVLKRAKCVVANSHNTKQILHREWRVPSGRICVLYPGVDCRRFVPAQRDVRVRRTLQWGERPVILTVGRLQKRKGHDQMILALKEIRLRIPDILYAVVGAGEERSFLEKLIHSAGLQDQVQFLGELPDDALIQCYQQCDLFVLPNRQVAKDFEGFGIVLLEAQACGKPVVTGASGGTAETMSAETGRVIACEEPGGLATLAVELLTDQALLARMGAAARNWVVDHFDWNILFRQAEQLFQQMAVPRRTGCYAQ
jgi:phosphatidylinositol alpha-1,6-mannosyltransferase